MENKVRQKKQKKSQSTKKLSINKPKNIFPVQSISEEDMAFPANVSHLMPANKDIPKEFWNTGNRFNQLASKLFFRGLQPNIKLIPREGVNTEAALTHITCVLSSFEPSHEYKIAAVANLIDQWFEDIEETV